MFSKSASSFSRPGCTFDVFLSFRGEDTRKSFIDHLYAALVQEGIHTFQDNLELPRGEEISLQLLEAIQKSRISIVVFSKGYASSRWCLNELVEILNCRNRNGQNVLPIFYDIDPSDVRKQTESFAEAFRRHDERFNEKMEMVNNWREALKEAGSLSGFVLENEANGYESKFIMKIVEEVSKQLDRKSLEVPRHLVGVDSLVSHIISMLTIATNDVRIVGIHGMSGIGKTTIAKVVFNQLCNGFYSTRFEGSLFLDDIGANSKKMDGLVHLQHRLLVDILKRNVKEFNYVDRGIMLIKERLRHKRVLVVLDDVDHPEQLRALIGERSWFGCGSRVIITSRDEHLLNTRVEECNKFHVKEMNRDKSLQLFSWHAFNDDHPKEDYMELSNAIVEYAGGLPLALNVLGCSLCKKGIPEWRSAIEKLRDIPESNILKKLRVCFDALDDDRIKGMFLDIACFFIGHNKEYAAKILEGRGFYPESDAHLLIQRSLLKINDRNEFEMHNLVRDMGREIVREKAPDNPGRRSRIWHHKDALDVLENVMGTEIVEGLALDMQASDDVSLNTKSFIEMRFLRLLQINGVHLNGSFDQISKVLIWLCWFRCPLKVLPSNFQIKNIVVLDMQHSNLTRLWKQTMSLDKLKILNLSHSKDLAKTPDFQKLPNLETLILEDCPSLVEVHESIGHLEKLVFLDLDGCRRLRNLPQSICNLKSLETLNLNFCSQLEELPERLGDMKSLTKLVVDGTAIRQLPSTIGYLKNLRKLSLSGCNYNQSSPSTSWLSVISSSLSVISSWLSPRSSNSKALLPHSLFGLSSLIQLNLSCCGLSEDVVSGIDLSNLSSIKYLDLSENNFFNLPSGIGGLPKLKELNVMGCPNLLSIPELPLTAAYIQARGCISMERVFVAPSVIRNMFLEGCQNLKEIEGLEHDGHKSRVDLGESNNLSYNCKKSIVEALSKRADYGIVFHGGDIPEWFMYREEGCSVSFKLPKLVSGTAIQGLLVWLVFAPTENNMGPHLHSLQADVSIKAKRENFALFFHSLYPYRPFFNTNNKREYSWLAHISSCELDLYSYSIIEDIEDIDELQLELSVELSGGETKRWDAERCGVHPIVELKAPAKVEVDYCATLSRMDYDGAQSSFCSACTKLSRTRGSTLCPACTEGLTRASTFRPVCTEWLIRDLPQLSIVEFGCSR